MTAPTQWSRVSAALVDFPVSATQPDGTPVTITGVKVALLPYRSRGPTSLTVWTAATWVAGVGANPGSASVLVIGPDATAPADGTPTLQIAGPAGADLWAQVGSGDETLPNFVYRIDLLADASSTAVQLGAVDFGDGIALIPT